MSTELDVSELDVSDAAPLADPDRKVEEGEAPQFNLNVALNALANDSPELAAQLERGTYVCALLSFSFSWSLRVAFICDAMW